MYRRTARSFCPDCGEPVIRARTEAMSWQLLNPHPDPAGNVHAYNDGRGNWFARTVAPGTPAAGHDRLMMPHYATSPQCREKAVQRRTGRQQAARPAEPVPLPANVTQLSTWKAVKGTPRRYIKGHNRSGPKPGTPRGARR